MALLTRHRMAGGRMLAVLALAAFELSAANAAPAKSKLTREYDLKAVFLFNFTQFVEWPPEAFPDEKGPFAICVLGEDPFGDSLDAVVTDEAVHDRDIVVRRYRDVEEITKSCHILFISRSEAKRLDRVFAFVQGKSILTVGEGDEFPTRAGMIGFAVAENKLRVKINVGAAKAAKLAISSKLLRQSEIVDAAAGP
jgi:hypothetical protein